MNKTLGFFYILFYLVCIILIIAGIITSNEPLAIIPYILIVSFACLSVIFQNKLFKPDKF